MNLETLKKALAEFLGDRASSIDVDALAGSLVPVLQTEVESRTDHLVKTFEAKKEELFDELKPYRRLGKSVNELQKLIETSTKASKDKAAKAAGVDQEEIDRLVAAGVAEQVRQVSADWEQKYNDLEAEKGKADELAARYKSRHQRDRLKQEVLAEARKLKAVPGLENELFERIAPIFEPVEQGEGDDVELRFRARNPRTKSPIVGSGFDGTRTPAEAVKALFDSRGEWPWEKDGRGFFVTAAGGSGAPGSGQPGAPLTLESVAELSMDEYRKGRDQGVF